MAIDLITELYNSFEPFQPPPEGAYVDCEKVRGDWSVVRELGRKITRSKQPTCQLYSGHRGVGKSTELLKLQTHLKQHKYHVVFFAADEQDIEPGDAEYADILFACTRHLVESIQLRNHNPLVTWMKNRWESLKDIAQTDVEVVFEGLSLEAQIAQFAKITANLRAVPDKRQEIRRKINANTPSLVEALNDFIHEAQKSLSGDCLGIVLIADNLDRIVETREVNKPSNYEEIYLNRSETLRGLQCHVVYTVPIKMVYSKWAAELESNYDKPDVLPMVMVRHPHGEEYLPGLEKLHELVCQRVRLIQSDLVKTLVGAMPGLKTPPVFDSPETLKQLCLMSGGHIRDLMKLIQKSIDWTEELPITAKAARRAVEEARETYARTIQEDEWKILARVCHRRQRDNDEKHLDLLLRRCLLEYRYYEGESLKAWCNVHPLIEALPQFQSALKTNVP